MFFVDTRDLGSGPGILDRLLRAGMSANRVVAFHRRDTIRFGVQEVTRRGFGKPELAEVARLLASLLLEEEKPEHIRPRVRELARQHRQVHYTGEEKREPALAQEPTRPREPALPRDSARLSDATASAAAARPRWIGIHLTSSGAPPRTEVYLRARQLGALAGDFPHQTDSAGNLSCTGPDGRLFVTGSGVHIKDLAPDDFVEITGRDGWTLQCQGDGPPSAEAHLHQLLRERTCARYVVHNHCVIDRKMAEEEGVLVLPPQEYGSVALAEAVAEGAARSQVMYVRRRGLVFWSPDFEECRELVKRFGVRILRHR
jgi:fluorothreonine transaldolase